MLKRTFEDLIALFVVGIREVITLYVLHAQVVPVRLESIPSGHDDTDGVFLLDLGEQHCNILVQRRIGLDVLVTLALLYGLFEMTSGCEFQQFSEDCFKPTHGLYLLVVIGFGRTVLSDKTRIRAMPF